MNKKYFSLGLMSGTSGDGVDASIIESDGIDQIKGLSNNYHPYPSYLSGEIHRIKEKIKNSNDLIRFSDEIEFLSGKLTVFHASVANKWFENIKVDIIGFHGQTIFHNPEEKISKQIGWGKKLSSLTKKIVVYDFRQNDLKNGGEGAPLTPIYHKLLAKIFAKKRKIKLPVTILNIGGIANITSISKNYEMLSMDIGPGNCLIDKWIRLNTDKSFDDNGTIARSGKIDKFILDQSLDNFYHNKIRKKKSFDINDFDLSFARKLTLENGAATLTEFTADILSKKILDGDTYVCGGGRKNKFLIESITKKVKNKIKKIDDLGIDGDFIESQAFAYLAIRSYLKLPISFPETTGCKKPCTGGKIVGNF
jgi:anhydro-N-acetylmuramic acid kinase